MKVFLFIIIIFLYQSLFAQTDFFNGDFEKTLELAQTENKLVILLFENENCAPCKKLEKEFFQDKAMGNFLNQNFIIRKVNAIVKNINGQDIYQETPDGNLAKKYSIRGFPNLVILKVDSLTNPVKIAQFEGLYYGKMGDKYSENHFLVDDNGYFRTEDIKIMFMQYIKS